MAGTPTDISQMSLAEIDEQQCALARQRLIDAYEAYNKLSSGKQARVFVDQNGERVEYKTTDRGKLASYIAELRYKIDPTSQSGPMEFTIKVDDDFLFFSERFQR